MHKSLLINMLLVNTQQGLFNRCYFMVNCDRLCLQYCLQWINGL